MELPQIIRRYEKRYQNALNAPCGKEKYDPNTIVWVCAVLKQYKTKKGAAAYIQKVYERSHSLTTKEEKIFKLVIKDLKEDKKHELEDKEIG